MAKLNYAGEYSVSELKLMSSSGNVLDLSRTYISLSLFEDIFSTSMTGIIILTDANNILMNMPITGQDYLSLKIETPSLEQHAINYTETVFSVTKIDNKIDADGGQVVQLHFCSPEMLRNQRTRISRSYTSTVSNIVYDVLNNAKYINTSKELFVEPTKNIRKIVIPNSHPFDAIKRLMREAESNEYSSPHYLFYENTLGIHFRSVESLFRQATTGYYHAGDVGTIDKKTNIEQEYFRVIDYSVNSNNDTLANILGGMLASKMITHDIIGKSYSVDRHDYFQDFYKYKRVNFNDSGKDNPIYNEVSLDEFGNNLGNFDDSVLHVHPTATINGNDAQHYITNALNEVVNPYTPNALSKTYLKRKAKFMELNAGTSIIMQVNGNTTIACGDIVEFNMPVIGAEHTKDKFDVYYSGRYLISKLRHIFDAPNKKHEIAMTLVKDSISQELPQNKDGTEPKGDKGMLHTQFF
tara:strand:- start:2216 stop:3616 length:1401 start_codon:yes stop_codon:yes gene_type:complete